MDFDAIVLAGGTSRRMADITSDKTDLDVGGRTLIDRAIAAVAGAGRIVVVGRARPVATPVTWSIEEPAGCGPAAGLMAGLRKVGADVVVVLAADLPFAATAVPRLLAALQNVAGESDVAMLIDQSGRRQPLLAAYTVTALRSRADAGPWANRSLRELVAPLRVVEVPAKLDEALDCDSPADLARARADRP
jgi:molybdopterin-guanine dinucleotide biosynthesis protein A